MCGIVGFVSNRKSVKNLEEATQAISHRGPDADGYYYNNEQGIGLGHRRLSILDLSQAANQPFTSQCGRYTMVFNGEIYNYKELQHEIKRNKAIVFSTNGDTEVLIEAFSLWGYRCVDKLEGMFACAIWDREGRKLYLIRDRLGIKPLYYYHYASELAFASELKALRSMSVANLDYDYQAVANFLHLGFIPAPQSIYRQIRKFPSGTIGIYENGKLRFECYWSAKDRILPTVISDEQEAKTGLKELLTEAVKKRLIADVPLGTFLSGGVDSSLITAVAQSLKEQPVKTFSIGFRESKFDESKYAAQIAKYLGTEHYEFILSEQESIDKVVNLLDIYDEPFADSSAVPMLLVSQMARKHVKVVLSGDGGDEQFFGYGSYQWAKRLDNPFIKIGRHPLHWLLKNSGNNRFRRAASLFAYPKGEIKSHIFSQEQYFFTRREIDELLMPEYKQCPTVAEKYPDFSRKLTSAEQQAFFDIQHYLQEDLLTKVDRASMHHGLEVRVPLLDHQLVQFSLNLKPSLKYRGGTAKYLLKEILYDYIPATYFQRPKWGFAIPLMKWLKTELYFLLEEDISDQKVKDAGLVKPEVVRNLICRFLKGEDYLYVRLWALVQLHRFVNR